MKQPDAGLFALVRDKLCAGRLWPLTDGSVIGGKGSGETCWVCDEADRLGRRRLRGVTGGDPARRSRPRRVLPGLAGRVTALRVDRAPARATPRQPAGD